MTLKTPRPKPPAPPKLPRAFAPTEILQLDDGDRWSQALVVGAQLTGLESRALTVERSRVEKVSLAGARLPRWSCVDSELERCDFSNLDAKDASFLRTLLTSCRLSGIRLLDTLCRDVEFRDCKMDYVSMQQLKCKQVRFVRCELREAEFYNCQFESVQLVECDLGRASFSNCRFEQCELRRCDLSALRGLSELRGVAMGAEDVVAIAAALAHELGISLIADD